MKLKQYRVRWDIDLEAPTPADAARLALEIQRDPSSVATFFEVRRIRPDGTKGKVRLIYTRDPDNDYAEAEMRVVASTLPDPADAEAEAYSDAAEADDEARMLREGPYAPPTPARPRREDDFFVVDGVVYERVDEPAPNSCAGCVAYPDPTGPLAPALCNSLSGHCFARGTIWRLAGENAAIHDGKLYDAVEQRGCTGCAGAGGNCLPDPCSHSRRADGRSVIWVEVKP